MKKKMILSSILFLFSMFMIPNVYADESVTDEDTLNQAISSGGIITIGEEIQAEEIIAIDSVSTPITIDLNGKTISREEGNCVFTIKNSNVTFIDSSNGAGKIDKQDGSTIYVMDNSTVTIKSGTYNGGIVVWGSNPKLNIEGGTITTDGFAVAGNGANTTESTIKITGGNLTSNESAAIYQPQTGTLTISNGNIKGKIGIVARGGQIFITGGNITATGSGTIRVGDAKVNGDYAQVPLGTAIVVDNTEENYSKATVKTTGGNFKTESDTPVVSMGKDATEIKIGAGATFDKKVDPIYLENGLVQNENGEVVSPTSIKDDTKNPDTSDANLYLLLTIIALSSCGIAYTFKKRFN